jgi:beta-galactosidase
MQPVTFTRQSYIINSEPAYLVSGEFHYFRVPRQDWRRRMQLFREAGGNCLATYIPWLLHEPEEGRFCFGEWIG